MENFLGGVLHKKLGQALIKRAGVEKLSLPVPALSDRVIERLAHMIKNYELKITGTTGFKNAQVTAGGLLTAEFDNKTMASKKAPGLYAAGEILDIFGDCGGYNLHWAWASGYLAGFSAAGHGGINK
ncbi:MAG: NAD(P)/FAD-dependent oxidoreductase, partial [Clostridiales bacterium]|jgi:predicted flavoprotein YhiN|nr:NAD(P)/FAD-dependent oxidoreductase [Clostridiales bacterium]